MKGEGYFVEVRDEGTGVCEQTATRADERAAVEWAAQHIGDMAALGRGQRTVTVWGRAESDSGEPTNRVVWSTRTADQRAGSGQPTRAPWKQFQGGGKR